MEPTSKDLLELPFFEAEASPNTTLCLFPDRRLVHQPLGIPRFVRLRTHDLLPKLQELLSLRWLARIASNHVVCWATLRLQEILLRLASYEETPDVDAPGPVAGALLSILLKKGATLIILVESAPLHIAPLSFQEIPRP